MMKLRDDLNNHYIVPEGLENRFNELQDNILDTGGPGFNGYQEAIE